MIDPPGSSCKAILFFLYMTVCHAFAHHVGAATMSTSWKSETTFPLPSSHIDPPNTQATCPLENTRDSKLFSEEVDIYMLSDDKKSSCCACVVYILPQ